MAEMLEVQRVRVELQTRRTTLAGARRTSVTRATDFLAHPGEQVLGDVMRAGVGRCMVRPWSYCARFEEPAQDDGASGLLPCPACSFSIPSAHSRLMLSVRDGCGYTLDSPFITGHGAALGPLGRASLSQHWWFFGGVWHCLRRVEGDYLRSKFSA